MPNQWTIAANGVQGGSNKSDLVGCHIAQNSGGTAYQFETPSGSVVSTTTGTTLPTPPFQFPMFTSTLAGTTSRNWYITVETLTGGASNNQAGGKWSNSQFENPEADPTDTWVAQAGASVGAEDEAAGASA
jgi:hypothetical protein